MHQAVLRWIDEHRPLAIGLIGAVLLAEFAALGFWLIKPSMDIVFGGPYSSACTQTGATRSRRATEACCEAGLWRTWPECEGTVAKRRALAALDAAHELNRSNRERWEERGPSRYRFSYRFVCFYCPGLSGYTFTSEVTGGVPVLTVTGQGQFGEPYDAEYAERYATMEAVFEAVDGAIESKPCYSVAYDRRLGHPTEFSWGNCYVTDSMTQYEVIDFQPLP